MIQCKGRNGWFRFEHFTAFVGETWEPGDVDPWTGYAFFFSSSPHTRSAPLKLQGPPRELARLLRRVADKLDTEHRAARRANINPQRKEQKP